MDFVAWHLDRSYLKSGWHCGNTFSPVLPNVRQHYGRLAAGIDVSAVPPKDIRPRSAGKRREQALEASAERVCRLLPLPRIRDISGQTDLAQGAFQEAALSSDAHLLEALRRPDPQDAAANKIERLRLSDLSWLSGEPLSKMASSLGELRELSLRGTRADDSTIAAIAKGCPKLESLDVSYCDITDLDCIVQLSKLQELRAARCGKAVTSSFVASLAALAKLEVLDLSYSAGVTDEALTKLAVGCIRLKWLCLESCTSIRDAGLIAILEANPGIQHLAMALNPRTFRDEAAAQAVSNVKRAKFIDFAGCPQLCRLFPQAVAKHCEYLEDLTLAGCEDLKDDAVRRLLLGCVRLRRLDLAGCRYLTVAPFLEALPRARSLRRLNVTHVPSITDQAVAAMYSASAGDGKFDASALVEKLNAAAAKAAGDGEDDDEDAGSGDSDGDDGDSDGAEAASAEAAAAVAAAVPVVGDATSAKPQLVIERFAQRKVDPHDLRDIVFVWRRGAKTKGKKKKSKGSKGKKKG